MTETTMHIHNAHVSLTRALQLAIDTNKSMERVYRPLLLAHSIVAEIREYSILGEKR